MKNDKKHIRLSFLIFFSVLLIAGILFWFQSFKQQSVTDNNNQQVACTMEAKLCPDGSSVGRFGPKCEFAPCPKAAEPINLKPMVDFPKPNDKIYSPLTVLGKARGTWFFEASFPVRLIDAKGNILTQGIAQAKADWMTENFIPFKSELIFIKPVGQTSGYLILKKDNPSGLPEYDDELKIPVIF